MANTLIPIQTYTLGSTTASVTFSNIPQNYTDLKFVVSSKGDTAGTWADVTVKFNSSTTGYTQRYVFGTGSAAGSGLGGYSAGYAGHATGTGNTANTFGSFEIYIPNYAGSTAKSFSFDSVTENNATSALILLGASFWSGTDAITTVEFNVTNGNFLTGSTITLYGVSNGVKATGGTLTVTGGYAYHTFTSTGSFLPSQQIKGAEILAIAGGGSGGTRHAGGGGAGGVAYHASKTLFSGNSYTALVGAGGASVANNGTGVNGNTGSNSVFVSIIANGGGGGGNSSGLAGGSGGGGGGSLTPGSTNQGITDGALGYGNNGGAGYTNPPTFNVYRGGGGGGAGAAGTAGSGGAAGVGGVGITNWSTWHAITGTGVLSSGTYYIAGGGGGASYFDGQASAGGVGGGGAGAGNGGTAGTANTGGGGGADGLNTGSPSGAGGSGLIIIRYRLD
jgi:hypothetical protein